MIEVPQVGFEYSANKSNVKRDILADWIEANILFSEPIVGKSDVVDMLIEYQVCPDEQQDLAYEIASEGWEELVRRQRWGGVPPTVSINNRRVEMSGDWRASPIWAFFVLLSIFRIFPDWASDHRNHVVQGDLFEKVVEEICPAMLPGWSSYRAGWSADNTKNIPDIVNELRDRLYVSGATDLNEWVSDRAKDGGLDIVCYRQFEDEREALPVFFLQCASGNNWRDKLDTPNPIQWQKYLNSAVQPSTGIVAPFVIDSKELKMAALTGQVVVFDRLRMLSAARMRPVIFSEELIEDLMKWMAPRVERLPRAA